MDLQKRRQRIKKERLRMIEFIKDVAKGPYKDSDISSLMNWYTETAKKILEELSK